ncbi:hypothetical protein ACFE04_021847 [Oxalis oulophora]
MGVLQHKDRSKVPLWDGTFSLYTYIGRGITPLSSPLNLPLVKQLDQPFSSYQQGRISEKFSKKAVLCKKGVSRVLGKSAVRQVKHDIDQLFQWDRQRIDQTIYTPNLKSIGPWEPI